MNFGIDATITVQFYQLVNQTENNQIYSTFSFKSNLSVKILPNGEILQKIENTDKHRVITSKGTNKTNGSKEVLYGNGNVSYIKDNKVININNKGYKIEKELDNPKSVKLLGKIPLTVQSDIVSKTNGVISIRYLNNISLIIHKDNIKIFNDVKDKYGNDIFYIEHDKYCTIHLYKAGKEEGKFVDDSEVKRKRDQTKL